MQLHPRFCAGGSSRTNGSGYPLSVPPPRDFGKGGFQHATQGAVDSGLRDFVCILRELFEDVGWGGCGCVCVCVVRVSGFSLEASEFGV